MRHKKKNARFDRTTSHRLAMFRNMVTSLLQYERISTTAAKAMALRGETDRMITLGKKGDLAAMRRALGYVRSKDVVRKLFSTLAQRYKERKGGYTRVIKLSPRRAGDCAPLAIIELVDRDIAAAPKRRVKKAATKEAGAA